MGRLPRHEPSEGTPVNNPVSTASTKPPRSTGAIVAALVLFFPLGLYWMWKGRAWSPKVRWIVTAGLGVALVAAGGGGNKTPAR